VQGLEAPVGAGYEQRFADQHRRGWQRAESMMHVQCKVSKCERYRAMVRVNELVCDRASMFLLHSTAPSSAEAGAGVKRGYSYPKLTRL
jgi:hypothetical protein